MITIGITILLSFFLKAILSCLKINETIKIQVIFHILEKNKIIKN